MPVVGKRAKGNVSGLVWQKIFSEAPQFFFNPKYTWAVGLLLLSFEIVLNVFIIRRISYTEIDWIAYMQEVEGVINGTYDYMKLKGDTGPLVYPAGFVYVYMLLYYATSHGANIKLAQYIFLIFYLVNLLLVVRIYQKSMKCPPYVLVFMCMTSYRVHSLFVLRLFNDPVAMLIFYMAVNFFISKKWYLGSFFFSLAVSVKMNILLFAPGLLLVYLVEIGILETFKNLVICALLQVLLALPFLMVNAPGYLMRSFDLGRQFFHQWTVNWRFLSEETFADRRLHVALLLAHVVMLLLFAAFRWRRSALNLLSLLDYKQTWNNGEVVLNSDQLVTVLFSSNFIGMCFSRSLHYQFYIWYYHTLPLLLWSTNYSTAIRLLIFGLIELCWNTYPSTYSSSACLHLCHLALLVGLWFNKSVLLQNPSPSTTTAKKEK